MLDGGAQKSTRSTVTSHAPKSFTATASRRFAKQAPLRSESVTAPRRARDANTNPARPVPGAELDARARTRASPPGFASGAVYR